MTAIYGLVGDFDPEQLRKMGERLVHRGSKAHEWSPAPRVLLGLRCPPGEESGVAGEETACVSSGALYNRGELVQEWKFSRALTDTEVLHRTVREHGIKGLSRLNGDYVFAAWIADQDRLVLARSPLGTLALYLWISDRGLAFASEYKSFLALDAFCADVDREALQHLQASKYVPDGRTLLKGVTVLGAGVGLAYTNRDLQSERFWAIQSKPRPVADDVAARELRELLIDAVRRRSQDVDKLAVELSGGVDSAGVVAALRAIYPDRSIMTFSIGSGPDDPELISSRLVSDHFETDHTELITRPDELPDLLPIVVWHLEDPIGRTESVLYYKLMQAASSRVKIVLGGYASDGLYAGMPKHKLLRLVEWLPIVDTGLEEFYHYSQVSRIPSSLVGRSLKRIYYGREELPMPRVIGTERESYSVHLRHEKRGLLDRMLKDGVLHGVPGWMPKVEKPHSAFNVEVRSPFTDPRLVQHAFGLPIHLRMRGLQDKHILRKALSPLLPDEIARRPKFAARLDYDLALSEALDEMAHIYLNPRDVTERGFFHTADIEALRERPNGRAYSENRAMRLWTAVTSEIWARIFLDAADATFPGATSVEQVSSFHGSTL